jgi:hypothetical protein
LLNSHNAWTPSTLHRLKTLRQNLNATKAEMRRYDEIKQNFLKEYERENPRPAEEWMHDWNFQREGAMARTDWGHEITRLETYVHQARREIDQLVDMQSKLHTAVNRLAHLRHRPDLLPYFPGPDVHLKFNTEGHRSQRYSVVRISRILPSDSVLCIMRNNQLVGAFNTNNGEMAVDSTSIEDHIDDFFFKGRGRAAPGTQNGYVTQEMKAQQRQERDRRGSARTASLKRLQSNYRA